MSRSIFGWSLPPGAAEHPSAPWNQDEPPCEICGNSTDDCICPECPVCECQGEPLCYATPDDARHAMYRTQEQEDSLADNQTQWAEQAQAEADQYAEQLAQEAEMALWETKAQNR